MSTEHSPSDDTVVGNDAPAADARTRAAKMKAERDAANAARCARITSVTRDAAQYQYPHLTREELAARWRVQPLWVTQNYQRIGLRPLKVGKRLLFSLDQVEAHERRAFGGVA
jgi:hypothetical protein